MMDRSYRRYVLLCAAIIGLCLALKLPSFTYPRQEYDERIYWELTVNWLENGSYSLQGQPVLDELPPSIYDKPLFHHPPLPSILLTPFVTFGSHDGAILVSWLGHVLAIVGVAMICWLWRRQTWHAAHFSLWLPVVAVAMDPILTFTARKIWPDNLVGGFGGLAMGLCCLAAHRRSLGWALAGGIVVGLAALAKLTALLLLPVGILLLLFTGHARLGRRLAMCAVAALAAAVVVLPWFAVFHQHYHAFLPTWIRPDAALIAASPHVAREINRPLWYYYTQTAMVAPIVLVLLVGYVRRFRLLLSPRLGIPLLWVAAVFVGLLLLRHFGHGMQLRYLTPAIPGLYVMLAALLGRANARRSLLGPVALLAVLYGVSTMGYFLYPDNLRWDDVVSLPEILRQMWTDPPLPAGPSP